MKLSLKIVSLTAGLVLISGLGARYVLADGSESCAGPARWDISRQAEKRLSALHDQLQLRPDQNAAWSTFQATLQGEANAFQQQRTVLLEARTKPQAVERLAVLQQGAERGKASLDKVSDAVRSFYANLDSTQQSRFDQQFRLLPPERHAWYAPTSNSTHR